MPLGETIVALATPAGESAIALVRLSGSLCEKLIEQVFEKKSPTLPRQASLGFYKDLNGHAIDRVLYVFFAGSKSYTGEPMLELSCHGNPLIVQKIVQDLIDRGCRMAEPGEFTRTAFINGKIDLCQAEAVADMIHAKSERALQLAEKQLAGNVSKYFHDLVDSLLNAIADVEVYVDFPEEDLPPENQFPTLLSLESLSKSLKPLIDSKKYKQILQDGIKVVIVGTPNAGKSSLLNTLVGENRSIVCEEPGTTRDFIAERIMIGPYCVRIIDTAGIRTAETQVEALGIQKTIEKIKEADFFLLVVDSTAPCPTLSDDICQCLNGQNSLVVENKIDLSDSKQLASFFPHFPRCRVSLKTNEGVEQLFSTLRDLLEKDGIVPSEDQIIISTRIASCLEKVKVAVDFAISKLKTKTDTELVTSDLRSAIEAVGDIIGKVDNEQMLDVLFSKFCIGK